MAVDTAFIDKHEGGVQYKPYVVKGREKSGVTIGRGIDLSHQSEESLRSFGLPEHIIEDLRPFMSPSVRGKAAEEALAEHKINYTSDADREAIASASDSAVEKYVKDTENWYNKNNKVGNTWDDLTDAQQTVLAAVGYQYGPTLTGAPVLKNYVEIGDWAGAEAELDNFKDKDSGRRKAEASLLREDQTQATEAVAEVSEEPAAPVADAGGVPVEERVVTPQGKQPGKVVAEVVGGEPAQQVADAVPLQEPALEEGPAPVDEGPTAIVGNWPAPSLGHSPAMDTQRENDPEVVTQSPAMAMAPDKEPPAEARPRVAEMAAFISADENALDVVEGLSRDILASGKVNEVADHAARSSMSVKERELQAYTSEALRSAGSPEEVEQILLASRAMREYEKAKAMGLVVEAEFLESIADVDEVSQEDIDLSAVDLQILKQVEDMAGELSAPQLIWDFANILFLPGDTIDDAYDLVGAGKLFNGREELQRAVVAFATMDDAALKMQMWNEMVELTGRKLNKTEQAGLLAAFASGTPAGMFEEYNIQGVAGSLATLVPIIGTLPRAVRSLSTSARVAYQMKNYRLAASMATRSLKNKEGAALGTSGKADSAEMATPFRIVGIDDNDARGLAPFIQREIQLDAVQMREMMDALIEGRSVLTPRAALRGERPDAEASLWNQGRNVVQNTEGDVIDLKIHRTGPESMELEITTVPKGTDLNDATPPMIKQVKNRPRRTDKQRNAVAEVEGEVNRINSQAIPKEVKESRLLGLLNKKGLRQTISTLAVNAARATDNWGGVLKSMEAGRWKDAARKVIAGKGPIKGWDGVKHHPELLNDVAADLKSMWVQSRGQQPKEVTPTVHRVAIAAQISDHTGHLEATTLPFLSWLRSNRAVSRTPDTIENYNAAAALDNISARVHFVLAGKVEEIFNSLKTKTKGGKSIPFTGNKRKQKVDRALLAGDENIDPETGARQGKVWTPTELKQKFGLDPQEQSAYYRLRTVYDHLHVLKNDAVRKELLSLGFQDVKMRSKIKFVDGNGDTQTLEVHDIGKPYLTADVARREAEGAGISEIFDFGTGTVVPYGGAHVKGAYDRGQQLVRLRNPFKDPRTGKRHQFVLADAQQEIKALPHAVLGYEPGFVPVVYDRGVWFVKAFTRDGSVDGRKVPGGDAAGTKGMSDNRAAATRLAENLNLEGDGGVIYRVVAADTMDPVDIMTSAPTGGGRLYVSARGEQAVPFYRLDNGLLVEEKASRLNALSALQGNISNLAYHYPRSQWRVAQALRLENTAKNMGVKYNGMHTPATDAGGGAEAVRFLNRQRTMLRDWLAAPDDAAVWWSNTMQHLYEKSLDTSFIPSNGFFWLKSRDPLTAIRAATFHLLLGQLNPAQLFVQAQGASLAASMHLTKDISKMFGATEVIKTWKMRNGLSILSNLDDATLLRASRELRKLMPDLDGDTAYSLAQAYRRSGLKEGVYTTADFAAIEMGYGQVMDVASSLSDKAMFFYRAGELFNREFSFTTAFRELLEADPSIVKRMEANRHRRMLEGGDGLEAMHLTDDELRLVVERANNLMLNLGRANKASYQKGVPAVGTQFWQVQAHMAEQLLLGGLKGSPNQVFTRKERMKIMIGQLGLYGASSVPLVGSGVNYYLSTTGVDVDSATSRGFTEGIYGYVFALLGADVEVSKRGAILQDIEHLAYDYILGDKTVAETLSGAFNTPLGRVGEAWKRMEPLRLSMLDADIPITAEDWLVAADAIGDISSSWSNLSKAYVMMMTDQVHSRSGKLLVDGKADGVEFSPATIMMQAMGFSERKSGQVYSLKVAEQMYSSMKADTKQSIRVMMLNYIAAAEASGDNMSPRMSKKLEKTAWVLMQYLNEADRVAMWEEIREELYIGKSELAKATNGYVRRHVAGPAYDEALAWYQKSIVGELNYAPGAIE